MLKVRSVSGFLEAGRLDWELLSMRYIGVACVTVGIRTYCGTRETWVRNPGGFVILC